jgi:peptidyl-prolyl cis-trans isomerase SurA
MKFGLVIVVLFIISGSSFTLAGNQYYSKLSSQNNLEIIDTNQTILSLYKRLIEGESFQTLAMLYSEDEASARAGGNLGWTKKGELVDEYERVAFDLEINEISSPFLTKYGWHIVQLLNRDGEKIKSRHILISK